ncbi:MAG: hypothetical protein NTV34_00960, partial [Proteobacteria bacterium]|nr:hypothetical protein [Pseudomonadota bacterium]
CNRMCGTDKSTTNFICYGNGFEISVTGPNLNQLKAELKIAKEGKAISMDSVARGGVQLNDSMIDGSNQFWNYRPYNPNYPVNAPGQPEQYSQGGVTVTRMPADKWGDDVWKVEGRGEAYYQATTYGNAILPCNQRGIEGSYPQ